VIKILDFLNETLKNLEYHTILEYISVKCVSESGKNRLQNSEIILDKNRLEHNLKEVSELKELYLIEKKIPLWSFQDIRSMLHKIEPFNSYLEAAECQEVQNLLRISGELDRFFKKQAGKYPLLNQSAIKINPLLNLLKLIENTIDPSGSIYDNASPELKKIRSEIGFLSKQIHIKLERIKKKYSEYLQEEFITLRDGRLVLPVREFSVNKIPGIVHGQSATGQTHYVEPISVVQLNNQMNELYAQEKKEIIRILQRLADNIRENRQSLLTNFEILTHFDLLQAKAQYAINVNGINPIVNEHFSWDIREGYHPLLLKRINKRTVPVSLKIGDDFTIMIISGPNAGGKTVALKTIGLLQLMFQTGFLIPVAEGSKLPVCKKIFTVIGDDQSIENDLSTFSSHITKLNEIIKKASPFSLILIDEIGTGTDPSEGSALAISVLEKLNQEHLITIVTTHHGELKAFAHNTEGVVNAAMKFDLDSLVPKYELEVGIPGSSYAFDISRRLGVSDEILTRAQEILGSAHHDLEEMIGNLSRIKEEYKEKLSDITIRESELDKLYKIYATQAEDITRKKNKYEKEALSEAQKIVATVNKTIEKVIREIRESQAAPDIVKKSRNELKEMAKGIKERMDAGTEKLSLSFNDFSIGQLVTSKRFSITGEIIRLIDEKNELEIESKGLRFIVPVEDVEMITKDVPSNMQKKAVFSTVDQVTNEIDLRGMTADEAIIELQRYLDSALLSDWDKLYIIHGKGSGILRKKIHEYLKKNKNIRHFRLGNYGEGDTGVTVIEL
jgi:DNA mismatch repair protein MutS2